MTSTEKDTTIGRAVARVRDRYRDTLLGSGEISQDTFMVVMAALNEAKGQFRAIEDTDRVEVI